MCLRELIHHHIFAGVLILFWLWISLSLIIRLWLKHGSDPLRKRLLWSFVLCIPFFGWLLYGAFYTPLRENDVKAPVNPDAQ
jgi:hypothetical protein